MEANVAIMEDTPTMKRFLHAVSEGDQRYPNRMVAAFYLHFTALQSAVQKTL